MPIVERQIENVDEAISRPVAFDVIRQVAFKLGLKEDIPIIHNGAVVVGAMVGSTLTDTEESVNWESREKIIVEVEETSYADARRTITSNYHDRPAIFRDQSLGVSIFPITDLMDVTINFTYYSKDKNSMSMWRNKIRTLPSNGVERFYHDCKYHYAIPLDNMYVLMAIHGLRENVAGYGEDIKTWLKKHFDIGVSSISNQSGTAARLAMLEKQSGIFGIFDFDILEKAQRDNNTGTYSCTFSYKFRYNRVIATKMIYPQFIHSQALAENIRGVRKDKQVTYSKEFVQGMLSRNLDNINPYQQQFINKDGVVIPSWAEWYPLQGLPGSRLFLTATIIPNEGDRTVINLNDLCTLLRIKQPIRDYMVQNPDKLVIHGRAPFTICLFENQTMINSNGLIVNSDLDLIYGEDFDLRKEYHMCIFQFYDLHTLSDDDVDDIIVIPELPKIIIPGVNPDLVVPDPCPRPDWDDLMPLIPTNPDDDDPSNRQVYFLNNYFDLVVKLRSTL